MKILRLYLYNCLILAAFLSLRICSYAQQYEVEGVVSHRIYMSGTNIMAGGADRNPTNKFFIATDGCKYDIRVELPIKRTYEGGYDGIALYRLIAISTPTNIIYNGIIDPESIPPDDGTTMNYLWLAYCSRCYFAGLTTNRLTPVWMLDDPSLLDSGFTVAGEWSLESGAPMLPMRVAYMNDGTHHGLSDTGVANSFQYKAPFDRGFTNAVYEVLQTTNIDGLTLPVKFKFVRYYVERDHISIRTLTEGTATIVRPGTMLRDFRPHFSGVAITVDKRFKRADSPVPHVPYWVTNGNWPNIEALTNAYIRQLSKYEAGLAYRAKTASKYDKRTKRKIILTIILILTVIPLSALIVNKQMKQNTKHEQNK